MQAIVDELPVGYRVEIGGAVEDAATSAKQMVTSFGISLLLIMLCPVFQYNGWAKPLIILTTLPMALIGAIVQELWESQDNRTKTVQDELEPTIVIEPLNADSHATVIARNVRELAVTGL